MAKPRRIVIPDEYVRTGRSMAFSSSANATISSKRRLISARGRPWMAPFRKTFSRPVKSRWKPAPSSSSDPIRPSLRTRPAVGLMMPAIRRRSVVLPEPLRPMRPTASPRPTCAETSRSAHTSVPSVLPRWTKRSLSVRASRACTRKRRATPSTEISPTCTRPRVERGMESVGEHPIPAGPLAVRWQGYELTEQRAGVTTTARVRLENAGSAPWRSRGREGIQLSYHWLDPLGNAIVWDGARAPLPDVVRPGDTVELESPLTAPRPPGRYRLAFDLVDEFRFWFQELGSTALELPVDVRPRIDERRLAVRMHGPS